MNFFDHFLYLLSCLDNRNYLLDNTINNLVLSFNVILHFPSTPVFNLRNYLFDNLLNFNNFRNLNHSLYNLFNVNRHFDHFFHNFFHRHNFLNYHLHLLDLSLNVINHFLDLNRHFNLHNFLFNHLNLHHFRNHLFKLNQFFHNRRDLNNSLNLVFIGNQLFSFSLYDHRFFNGNMHYFLHLFNLFNFYNLLHNFLDSDYFWNFNYPFHDFLYNLFNFDDFRSHSKDLENVIYRNNIHNLCFNHTNNSLINLKDNSCFELNFFQFFKKSLDEYSQMELNFPLFLCAMSIDIFYFYDLRNILDDLDQFFNFIHFDNVNHLLHKELS